MNHLSRAEVQADVVDVAGCAVEDQVAGDEWLADGYQRTGFVFRLGGSRDDNACDLVRGRNET